MRRRIPFLVPAALVALLVLGPAVPLLAQEEGEPPAGGTPATSAEADAPAVVLSDEGAPEDDAAWTFRFLVPTVLALSGLTLAAVAFLYGVRVRGRYRVVR